MTVSTVTYRGFRGGQAQTLRFGNALKHAREQAMSRSINVIGSIAGAMAIVFAQPAISADQAMPEMSAKAAAPSAADAKLIQSAMKAAPKKVSGKATIVVMNADGTMRTLREGTNGFTCMPDSPATPGPSAMCMDKASMAWAGAWIGHKDPPAGSVGFMYMLAGGTDASNTDPYAMKPSAENHWIKTGPHVMVVGADAAFYDSYPKSADPDTGAPYVMWAGTPYQHLMVPIK